MNRKFTYQFISLLMLATALTGSQLWANDSDISGEVEPITPEVSLKVDPSFKTPFGNNRKDWVKYNNFVFMNLVTNVAKIKYGELSQFMPIPFERTSDKKFELWFVGNSEETAGVYGDVYGDGKTDELRIYDQYMSLPQNQRGLGLVVHEVAHLIQLPYRDKMPPWLMEAISDYFRYTYQEEQNIYWYLGKTKAKLAELEDNYKRLEKKAASGDSEALMKLEDAKKDIQNFQELGFRQHPKQPEFSAGLLTLIDDDDQLRRGETFRERNFKAKIVGEVTHNDGTKEYQLDVQVRNKAVVDKVYYVNTFHSRSGGEEFVVDSAPDEEATTIYKVVTTYDQVKKLQDEKRTVVPKGHFMTKLNSELFTRLPEKRFRRLHMSAFLSREYGVDLASYWREYLARAYATKVPFINDIKVTLSDNVQNELLRDAKNTLISKLNGENPTSERVNFEKGKLIHEVTIAAKKAIQAPYIRAEESETDYHKSSTHSWWFTVPLWERFKTSGLFSDS